MTMKYTFKDGDEVYLFDGARYQKATVRDMNPVPSEPGFCKVSLCETVEMIVSKDDLTTPEEMRLFNNDYWLPLLKDSSFLFQEAV